MSAPKKGNPGVRTRAQSFARVNTQELRALLVALRELQRQHSESFWDLEQKISRIADELERRKK